MRSELSLQATRAAYIGRQLPRLLWYVGHGYIMGRLAEKAHERDGQNGRPRARATAPVPDRGRLYRDMASRLFPAASDLSASQHSIASSTVLRNQITERPVRAHSVTRRRT